MVQFPHRATRSMAHLLVADQGVDVEGQEEPVEQVVGQHVVQELTVNDQDVIEIVQVVQVLSDKVTKLPPVPVPVERENRNPVEL